MKFPSVTIRDREPTASVSTLQKLQLKTKCDFSHGLLTKISKSITLLS